MRGAEKGKTAWLMTGQADCLYAVELDAVIRLLEHEVLL